MNFLAKWLQTIIGFTIPLPALWMAKPFLAARDETDGSGESTTNPSFFGALALMMWSVVAWLVVMVGIGAIVFAVAWLLGIPLTFTRPPTKSGPFDLVMFVLDLLKTVFFTVTFTLTFLLCVFCFGDWPFLNSFRRMRPSFQPLHRATESRIRLISLFYRLLSMLAVIGLSILPLTALIVALPAVSPNEAVLSDSVKPATTWWRRFFRRVFAIVAGVVVIVALVAISIEFVSLLGLPERGRVGAVMEKALGIAIYKVTNPKISYSDARVGEKPPKTTVTLFDLDKIEREKLERRGLSPQVIRYLSEPLSARLPKVLIQHWPFVFLAVYAFDLLLLLAVGKVPVAYNWRNLIVRWVISAMTALAFTVVVGLVVVLLAFVNGMYELNENSGVPGNVFILSDGSTDELFSNLGYGDVDNIPREVATLDRDGDPLPVPVKVKQTVGSDGKPAFLMSKEIFYTVNQTIPNPNGGVPKRRFLALRAMDDGKLAGEVHNAKLFPGGKWFDRSGVQPGPNGKSYIQTVVGDGVASLLGDDYGKPRLGVGDTFQIGDTDWIITGVIQSEGKTLGSEMWCQNTTLVTKPFGKDKYTTLVLRVEPETQDAARAMAHHLQYRYDQQKLKTFSEQDYFLDLTRTNEDFLFWIIFIAVIMAVGGVFGVMNTMFASIQARIKEVGVLRILGFKRWQILISFMLESLVIAFVGGLVGCLLGCLANGFEATSTLGGGGGGGGKRVLLKLTVDYQTFAAGMLFTLMMGRIGGLVPALSAMRMKILDTLK